jgi:hypothetical protein
MIHGHRHIRGCEPTTLESTGYKQDPPTMEAPEQKKRKDIALKSQKNDNTEDIEVSFKVSSIAAADPFTGWRVRSTSAARRRGWSLLWR